VLEYFRMEINTDENKIEDFLIRGVEHVLPSRDFVRDRLRSGEKLTVYYGIDPTGPSLHIGHAIPIKKLAQLQNLGHHIIFLIGDFTAKIGDPTDKLATRVALTSEQVAENLKNYKAQASKIVAFDGENPAEFRFNSEWLGEMKFADVLELASKATVQQMLERDMFKKRIEEGKPIHLHEFMYPLMQGADSVALMVDGELGGNDQLFNMLMGRTLLKECNKEKFVMVMKLLTDNSGKKMGKSEGNMITLEDSADEMFGKIMSWTDSMIFSGFELCTNVSQEEILEMDFKMQNGENPIEFKKRLAREIVTIYHSFEDAAKAQVNWENTFSKGGLPDEIPEIKADEGSLLSDVLVKEKLIESKSDFRRLIEEGAIKLVTSNSEEKILDIKYSLVSGETKTFKIGKRIFITIIV